MVRKSSVKEDKFRLDLEGCIRLNLKKYGKSTLAGVVDVPGVFGG